MKIMRKMATIRKIDEINPIDGADAIEVATVGGWKVVVRKGEYSVGDLAVYCEIDSWIPTELAPFLTKGKEPREYNGVKGERLRTVKLRGQLSQGLLIPLIKKMSGNLLPTNMRVVAEGEDVTDELGIKKWEMQVPAQLAGQVKGNFPSEVPKTDQERVQNLTKHLEEISLTGFEVTEKLEGSSMTCYLIDGEFGVCSRNMDLKRDENNSFWAVAIEQDIEAKMRMMSGFSGGYAIQGELIGPGIQGNIYKLSKPEFYVFDVYNIADGCYLTPLARRCLIVQMGLNHVPVINPNWVPPNSIDGILEAAEGKATFNPQQEREGIVFKANDGSMTFKAISNRYLMKQKD